MTLLKFIAASVTKPGFAFSISCWEPLCVCNVLEVLRLPQVAGSKQLTYQRTNGLIEAERYGKWMIYRFPKRAPVELDLQPRCLQDCVSTEPIFREDLKRLSRIRCE